MLGLLTERKKRKLRWERRDGVWTEVSPSLSAFCLSAEGTDSVRLSEIYGKLEEIEADKAPARYLRQPHTHTHATL